MFKQKKPGLLRNKGGNMIHNTIQLDIDYEKLGIKHNDILPSYTTYILDTYPQVCLKTERPLVVICPGGGYGHHSPREGEAMAIRMNSLGMHAVVLRYSLSPNEYPCAILELMSLMKIVKDNAKQWGVIPNKIIVAGFSAGAHLAATLGTEYGNKELLKLAEVTESEARPDGMLLGYPVITSGEFAHKGSFEKLLGTQYDILLDRVSIEKNVTKDTPKAFIWHTFEDSSVPVENSLLLANALRKASVQFELHIFPRGGHGIGLANSETNTKEDNKVFEECQGWPSMFAKWVDNCVGV